MKIRYLLFFIGFLSTTGWWSPFSIFSAPTSNEPVGSRSWIAEQTRVINSRAGNIDPSVLKMSLTAYVKARQQGLDNKQLLTIIDYSKPSSEKRLWVVDLRNDKVLFNTWVTHGKNSGIVTPTSFSNRPGSLKSSIGVFLTEETYIGGNGYSLRLKGLERGINDNAYERNVVVHGAWYADSSIIKQHGALGRSWGCPAVSESLARPLIDTIKEKTLVFVYAPDRVWQRTSAYLAG